MELRLKRGLTQQQVSELTGIAQSEISRIERGVISATDRTLTRVADALGAETRLVDVAEARSTERARSPVSAGEE